MVMDALRGYVQLASGLTEVTRQKAQAAAKALLQQTGADTLTSGLTTRVSELTDEIVATSKSNRQLLQAIVTNEVEGAVARLGFVRSEEVAALTRRVKTLESELAEARDAAATPVPAATNLSAQAAAATARKAPAKKAPAKKTAAVKKTAVAKKSAVKKAPAKKTAQKTAQKTAKKTAKKA
jgi:polyhydroxyalkanoate synthesis regulator phasin